MHYKYVAIYVLELNYLQADETFDVNQFGTHLATKKVYLV